MLLTVSATALLMGLSGAPHCAAMCGPACGAIAGANTSRAATWVFQAGRLAGYMLAGAVAAAAVQGLGVLTTHTAALRPAWLVFHLLVLAWGLTLLAAGRQPAIVTTAGRAAWLRLRPLARRNTGVFAAGAFWIFLPCGLLWSALAMASLSGGPLQGAFSMALFAGGSSLGLLAGPMLFRLLRQRADLVRREWGTRMAGMLVALASGWAVWMDLSHRLELWCA